MKSSSQRCMFPQSLPGIILGMGSANERRRYIAKPPLIGRAHTQNDPYITPNTLFILMFHACYKAVCMHTTHIACIIRNTYHHIRIPYHQWKITQAAITRNIIQEMFKFPSLAAPEIFIFLTESVTKILSKWWHLMNSLRPSDTYASIN